MAVIIEDESILKFDSSKVVAVVITKDYFNIPLSINVTLDDGSTFTYPGSYINIIKIKLADNIDVICDVKPRINNVEMISVDKNDKPLIVSVNDSFGRCFTLGSKTVISRPMVMRGKDSTSKYLRTSFAFYYGIDENELSKQENFVEDFNRMVILNAYVNDKLMTIPSVIQRAAEQKCADNNEDYVRKHTIEGASDLELAGDLVMKVRKPKMVANLTTKRGFINKITSLLSLKKNTDNEEELHHNK